MNKYIKHTIPRLKLVAMTFLVLLLVLVWPILYVLSDPLWLYNFKSTIIKELDSIRDEINKNSLW
ncbi:hypothetical protein [Flavobacterium sp. HNIBRBA15423]|uniref:hypothetical protein n=1 Tax=Flavobacterium sp. HNIBRBA15423 TaxID=3458683 RepID=UPI004044A646